jgi:two-component system NtrC family response regulator
MPAPLQLRLLRYLEKPIDVRIISATHQDVEALIAGERLGHDLYYRLAEMVIRIPALADRPGDAALLARHFLNRHAAALNPQVTGLAPDAMAAIDAWSWPGNVRELENRVKRAVIMAEGKLVTARDLDLPGDEADGGQINLKAAREQADRQAIRRAMSRSDGNISSAARLLGISRPTLYELMKTYDLSA